MQAPPYPLPSLFEFRGMRNHPVMKGENPCTETDARHTTIRLAILKDRRLELLLDQPIGGILALPYRLRLAGQHP